MNCLRTIYLQKKILLTWNRYDFYYPHHASVQQSSISFFIRWMLSLLLSMSKISIILVFECSHTCATWFIFIFLWHEKYLHLLGKSFVSSILFQCHSNVWPLVLKFNKFTSTQNIHAWVFKMRNCQYFLNNHMYMLKANAFIISIYRNIMSKNLRWYKKISSVW